MQLRRLYKMPRRKDTSPKIAKVRVGNRDIPTLCGDKHCYDKRGATIAKIRQSKKSAYKLYIYPCRCGFWHLTSKGRSYDKLKQYREKKREFTAKPFITKSVI